MHRIHLLDHLHYKKILLGCCKNLQSGSFFFCDKNGPVDYVRVTDQAVKRSRYHDDPSMREMCIYLCFSELVLITRTIYLYMNFN